MELFELLDLGGLVLEVAGDNVGLVEGELCVGSAGAGDGVGGGYLFIRGFVHLITHLCLLPSALSNTTMLTALHPGPTPPLALLLTNLNQQLPNGNHQLIALLHTQLNSLKLFILFIYRLSIYF